MQRRILIPGPNEPIPARVIAPPMLSRGTLVLIPGLFADKSVHEREQVMAARAGFTGICLDAPHHGERDDGALERLNDYDDTERHYRIMAMVEEAVAEIPAVLSFCRAFSNGPICLQGTSYGGFVTLAAATRPEARPDAAAALLASPDWTRPNEPTPPDWVDLAAQAPIHSADQIPPTPLFVANAGEDEVVPVRPARALMAKLEAAYAKHPGRLQYWEYQHSRHAMQEEDWTHLWGRLIQWLLHVTAK